MSNSINNQNRSKLHPNLKQNYFRDIDTNEKAYWLGFIYADGCISIDKRSDAKRFKIEIHLDDENLLDKFANTIRFNLKYKSYRKNAHTVRIRLGNKNFIKYMINHGITPRKSNIIKLPDLNSRALYLAFLLGYFDGDGTTGTSKITSGSKLFLEEIKELFQVKSKIHKKYSYGKAYDLHLGAELFNEMLDNFKESLERKRIRFSLNEQRIENIKKKAWKGGSKRKLVITKQDLENLVWIKPKIKIAEEYDVSDKTIDKYCKKWNIKTPPRGYWNK